MASPRHPMVWRRVSWHAVGGAVACHGWYHGDPRGNATALHGNPAECHDNPYGTPMSTATRLGLGLRLGLGVGLGLGFHGIPWRSVEGSVVCRGICCGRLCCRCCHGMPRHFGIKDNNVHPPLALTNTCLSAREGGIYLTYKGISSRND